MLKSLVISNILLIESARLDFSSGLTTLTGETGAGKSAILKALSLTLGGRSDLALIRQGGSKGRVEAAFDVDTLPQVLNLLDEAGIDQEEGCELIISREIVAKGSSRAFVNQQMVQTSFLKKLSACLLDLVGQSANIRLTSPAYHLETVDLYGDLQSDVESYRKSYEMCQDLRQRIERLTQTESERLRKGGRLAAELEEITNANPQEGEEEALFQEYTKLTHSEELAQLVHGVLEGLEGDQSTLSSCQKQVQRMAQLDGELAPSQEGLEGILVEIRELAYTLQQYQEKLTYNPERLETVNSRLTALDQLNRKYGPDLLTYRKGLEQELEALSGGEEKLEALTAALAEEEKICTTLAQALSNKRKKVAQNFQEAVTAHLRPLNLREAQFEVEITPIAPGIHGADAVEFYFAPNLGEGSVAVRKAASGGELSRLLLALKTALSGLEKTPTLIFDEIDAGMGGKTAVLVGQKLKTIATGRQVLCITHLPQVARQADHHFAIEKVEASGRTLTQVREVKGDERRDELVRMQGGDLALNH